MTAIQKKMAYHSTARSHVGTVRLRNEDAVLERPEIGLWAVADGVGGHQRGDYASKCIVTALGKVPPAQSALALAEQVKTCLAEINRHLRATAAEIGPQAVIGSTVVVLLIGGGQCRCLWAGDSRFYLLRAGELRQMSRDQSYLVDHDEIGAEAVAHPLAHVITNAVGASAEFVLEERQDHLEPGDTLLLCSDGLTRVVTDTEIAAILGESPLATAADVLIERALAAGARDNVSVVVIEYEI